MLKLILIGIQGAGKSTQGNLLSQKLDIPYLSSGHIFREMAKEKTPLGRFLKETMNAGALIPDDKTIEIIEEYLAKPTTFPISANPCPPKRASRPISGQTTFTYRAFPTWWNAIPGQCPSPTNVPHLLVNLSLQLRNPCANLILSLVRCANLLKQRQNLTDDLVWLVIL